MSKHPLTPHEEHTDIQLINKYIDLLQKRRAGRFNWGAAMIFQAIKSQLKSRGYVLSEDENTWYYPA